MPENDFATTCVQLAEERIDNANLADTYIDKLVHCLRMVPTREREDALFAAVDCADSKSKTSIMLRMGMIISSLRRRLGDG